MHYYFKHDQGRLSADEFTKHVSFLNIQHQCWVTTHVMQLVSDFMRSQMGDCNFGLFVVFSGAVVPTANSALPLFGTQLLCQVAMFSPQSDQSAINMSYILYRHML